MRWLPVCLAIVLAYPGAATAGWRGAEWGMAPEEVATILPDAPLSKGTSGDRLGGKTIGNVGQHTMGKEKLKAVFYYDERGLQSVGLSPRRPKSCPALTATLIETYGEPLRISDQQILMLIIWHDRPTSSRIRLLVLGGRGGCTLYYERLSDYEEADKRLR